MSLRGILQAFQKQDYKTSLISLPYASSLNQSCRACQGVCKDVCEQGIIIKEENSLAYLDFSSNGCTFCKKCALACEEFQGEHSVLNANAKEEIQAVAKIDVMSCLAYHKVICSSCKDVCGGNIKFSGMFYPEILDTCVGCGLCVSRCPNGAIEVLALGKKNEGIR